ncbi:Double zinc ribbon and ankyrin repeat-containing protein 1 [Lonchura striata]|uniref:Double zinc ribbon and ankyrin repeat-containing protein 1 n=1 Tax=Lonchura striata TaxID=40157 RepID=A0A218V895_9PASE|nr:Double zinc ribbon and ankyrin repeat-containing protein 1 [Lonchura striata domestica]
MTAGSVSAPQIIPLRIPPPGKAQREIDTNTLIEIKSDTPEASIYYTLDGSKPELIRKPGYGPHNTLEYKGPIILPVGKIIVKALAVTKDYRESSIVTKVFVVEYQQPNILFPVEDDDKNFLKDIATQMALCLECKHLVPMNTPTCIICEAPIAPQLQPQNNICVKLFSPGGENRVALVGTWSSARVNSEPVFGGDSCPSLQGQQRETARCFKCNGVNQSDARFCAWCGAKPGPPPSYFSCSKCGTTNQPYARFCVFCGVYIEPPSRQSSPGSPMERGDSLGSSQAGVAWKTCPVSLPKSRAELTEREDKGTQTIGLFYPSSKLLEKKALELISQKEKVEKMSDHKPLLTAISPGKGYWRKQLDHVCAHARSYAQNNLEFRTLIGEPQMGKINYATVSEDDYEVTITLNFAAVNKDIHPNKAVKFSKDYLSAGTEATDGQDGSQTNFESRQLLDELGRTGKGRITFIEQLLNDGADPNSLGEEERPALTVAVLNKHTGAISPLVQKGADIDQQSGPQNNTALHEAVLLGLEGEECIRALLW